MEELRMLHRDPKAFRDRFNRWKEGKPVYQAGRPLPAYDEGGDFEEFRKTLPYNQAAPGAYNTERYWELNGKPKTFGEAVGKGMYTYQDGGWHANSVAYNEQNDTYEFMKPNYHPTRWMELVYGYDKDPEFLKDWKVEYNGPMLSDRYVRREKPGLKIVGGQLPKLDNGQDAKVTRVYKPFYDTDGVLLRNVEATLPEITITNDIQHKDWSTHVPKNAVVQPDYRSQYQLTSALKEALYAALQYQKQKEDAIREEGFENLMKLTSPATYAEGITGKDFGPVGRIAFDVAAFGLSGAIKRGAGSIAKSAIKNKEVGLILNNQLALPFKPQIADLPPEATYTGRIPKRTLNLQNVADKNAAEQVLKDIQLDPSNYTFKEINTALENYNSIDDGPSFILPSSGKTILLGNNNLELLKTINLILSRYGYEQIPYGMDDVATRLAVLDRIKLHRTFGRGVYLKPRGSHADIKLTQLAARNFGVPEGKVTGEMKLQTAATHTIKGHAENGRQGLSEALEHYNLPRGKYDAVYTSNRDEVMAGYSNPGYGNGSKGAAYLVRLPINDSDKSASLLKLWENNEFPIMDDGTGKLTGWRTHELPYILKTGKQFSDLPRDAAKLKEIEDAYNHAVNVWTKEQLGKKITYKDTEPTTILKQYFGGSPSYNGPAKLVVPGGNTVDNLERFIANNNKFQSKFGKVVNPVIERKLGLRLIAVDEGGNIMYDLPFTPPDAKALEIPDIVQSTIKYPRAYKKMTDTFSNISRMQEAAVSKDYQSFTNAAYELKQDGIISDKQYKAIRNSLKSEHPDPEKYVDYSKAVKMAQNLYFKSLGKERSADAFLRKRYVERHNSRIDDLVANAEYDAARQRDKLIARLNFDIGQAAMKEAGVSPNYSLLSPDGYRIFTTEGIKYPSAIDTEGTHFVVVGPKDKKMLDVIRKYEPKSSRRHHGHGGGIVEGLSRNLGGIALPFGVGLTGYGLYNK